VLDRYYENQKNAVFGFELEIKINKNNRLKKCLHREKDRRSVNYPYGDFPAGMDFKGQPSCAMRHHLVLIPPPEFSAKAPVLRIC
jgi:hypothetical protein